jgi:hypothetical protein
MMVRRAVPNVARRTRGSWNLAISRHGATRTITSVRGANGVHVRMCWLTSPYPLATESTRVALALLFPLV